MKTKKLNTYGIAHLALILGLVVVVGVLAAGFRFVQQNERKKENTASTSQKATTDAKNTLNDTSAQISSLPINTNQPQSAAQTPQSGSGSNKSTTPAPKTTPIQGAQPSTSAGS